MLTPQEHVDIAYAAFQTHAKVAAAKTGIQIPTDDMLVRAFNADADLQTLWKGLVVSIIANALEANDGRAGLAARREQDPNQRAQELAKKLAHDARQRGVRSSPIGSGPQSDGMSHIPPASVSDMVPGLAVGRCTEGPTDGGGSSDTGCTDSGGGSDGGGGGGCD